MTWLYCCSENAAGKYVNWYRNVLERMEETFGVHSSVALFSAPGRTEIGGNHTDHQHGRVLAGSVNIDMVAPGGANDLNQLRLKSEGYEMCVIDLSDLGKRDEKELGWDAEYGVEDMCAHSWNWQSRNPDGYQSCNANDE